MNSLGSVLIASQGIDIGIFAGWFAIDNLFCLIVQLHLFNLDQVQK